MFSALSLWLAELILSLQIDGLFMIYHAAPGSYTLQQGLSMTIKIMNQPVPVENTELKSPTEKMHNFIMMK